MKKHKYVSEERLMSMACSGEIEDAVMLGMLYITDGRQFRQRRKIWQEVMLIAIKNNISSSPQYALDTLIHYASEVFAISDRKYRKRLFEVLPPDHVSSMDYLKNHTLFKIDRRFFEDRVIDFINNPSTSILEMHDLFRKFECRRDENGLGSRIFNAYCNRLRLCNPTEFFEAITEQSNYPTIVADIEPKIIIDILLADLHIYDDVTTLDAIYRFFALHKIQRAEIKKKIRDALLVSVARPPISSLTNYLSGAEINELSEREVKHNPMLLIDEHQHYLAWYPEFYDIDGLFEKALHMYLDKINGYYHKDSVAINHKDVCAMVNMFHFRERLLRLDKGFDDPRVSFYVLAKYDLWSHDDKIYYYMHYRNMLRGLLLSTKINHRFEFLASFLSRVIPSLSSAFKYQKRVVRHLVHFMFENFNDCSYGMKEILEHLCVSDYDCAGRAFQRAIVMNIYKKRNAIRAESANA